MSVRGFAKSFILFFLKPFHINKDTRLQNIDVCEDIFAVKKVIVCICKKTSHNYPTITGKNFDVFSKNSADNAKKSLHLIATRSSFFGGICLIISQIFFSVGRKHPHIKATRMAKSEPMI